jgi:hypothetical protein
MLCKDYNLKCSVEKISGRGSQGVWRQDELIGGKNVSTEAEDIVGIRPQAATGEDTEN